MSADPTESTSVATPVAKDEAPKTTVLRGLRLALNNYPLHKPIQASEEEWQAYTYNRHNTSKVTRPVFSRRKGYQSPSPENNLDDGQNGYESDMEIFARNVRRRVREIEEEAELPKLSLQKAVRIFPGVKGDRLSVGFEEYDNPTTANVLSRVYSPVAPTYIDVHMKYWFKQRYYENEWNYSIGFKISSRMQETAADSVAIVGELGDGLQTMHTKNGWRSISWGFYPARHIEEYGVDIYHDALLDIYKALFGEDLKLAEDASEDVKTEYRRKLLRGLRLLLAAVGIGYGIAVTDDEEDEPPESSYGDLETTLKWQIEGLADKWFGRLARKACGFQLTSDPKNATEAKKYAIECAKEAEEDEERGFYSDDDYY